MAKKIMDDFKSKGAKIRDISRGDIGADVKRIPVSSKESTFERLEREIEAENHTLTRAPKEKLYTTPRPMKSRSSVSRPLRILLIAAVIIGAGYFISTMFEGTRVIIKQRHESLALDKEQFTASTAPDAPIHFDLMIVSDTQSKDLVLTDSENVSLKAHGEVTLYNEYSTKNQNLLIHTMLSDKDGKTYQTDKAVVIPGYKLDASKKIVPGSVVVGITSFLAGSSYNGSPSDLTINGFKGTDKFKKMYAKLKTPLTGGAQGLVYKLSPQDAGSLNAEASSRFKSSLLNKVNAQVPEGYVLYPNALAFSYKVENDALSPTPTYKAKITGTISAIILEEKDLSDALIKKLLPDTSPKELDEIQIGDIAKLSFGFANGAQAIDKDIRSVSFNLTGTINPLWQQDVGALKESLRGKAKSELQSFFKSDPGISSASAKIFPPWNSHLPDDSEKIHITLE